MTGRVVSLHSILVDIAVDVPRLPERGGDLLGSGGRVSPGGGFNLAAAAARQGAACVYAGPHGTGPNGDLVRQTLAAEGIAVTAAPRPDADTGFCVVLVEPDGERTFVTSPGVEAQPTPAEVAAADPAPGDWVALSGYDLVYPGAPVLADWVEAHPETRIALDPGPLVADIAPELLRRVLPRLGILTLNAREARLLAGTDAEGAALVDAVRPLAPAALVVVRDGANGCVASGSPLAEPLAVPAPRVAAVDTTGAGDTHTGVLLAELALGRDVPTALARATAAAALSVTAAGPATAPTAAELDAFLARRE